jgi:hypothetical protein
VCREKIYTLRGENILTIIQIVVGGIKISERAEAT